MTNNEAIDQVREVLAHRIFRERCSQDMIRENGEYPSCNKVEYLQLMEDADLLLCELLEK